MDFAGAAGFDLVPVDLVAVDFVAVDFVASADFIGSAGMGWIWA